MYSTDTLRHLLTQPIERNSDVVYLLVEIRKVIESMVPPSPPRFSNLKFFCDWALHAEVNRNSVAKDILKLSDSYLHKGANTNRVVALEALNKFRSLVALDPLRDELLAFLIEHGLNVSLVANQHRFYNFIGYYLDTISHTPLALKGLTHLDEIRISLIKLPGEWKWDWTMTHLGKEVLVMSNVLTFPSSEPPG